MRARFPAGLGSLAPDGHEGARSQQISLTMNTYAHVRPKIERDAVDAASKRRFG
jgi:hypothetical protein